jgi:hypothetical protein
MISPRTGLTSSGPEDAAYLRRGAWQYRLPRRRSDLGEGDRASGLALTIQIVARHSPAQTPVGVWKLIQRATKNDITQTQAPPAKPSLAGSQPNSLLAEASG